MAISCIQSQTEPISSLKKFRSSQAVMGKLKRGKRNQRARHNPLGKKSKSEAGLKEESTRKSKILPLIEKLLSSSPNDRSMALGAITILSEDEMMRKLLLKERLVPILMEQFLNDNNDELVVETFGLLRNIGIDEGYDILKYYWRSNIWISIESSLAKIKESYKYLQKTKEAPVKELTKNQKEDEKSKQQLLFDFTEHILSLVAVIASGSDDLFDNVFSKIDPVLEFVIELLNYTITNNTLPTKLNNVFLDFIYEFSSESNEFIKKLQATNFNLEAVQTFAYSPAQASNNLGKTYVEGLKFHLNEVLAINTNKNEVAHSILTNLFQNITDIDLDGVKSSLVPNDNANEPIQANKDIDQQISGTTEESQAAKINLQNIEIAVDLTTSIFEYLAINEDFNEPVQLSPELIDLLFRVVIPALLELVKFDQSNHEVLLLAQKLIICLNNLAWLFLSLDNIPVQWYEVSLTVWDLTILVSHTEDIEIQKSCLSLLWAITKFLGPEVKSKVSPQMISDLIGKCDTIISSLPGEDEQLGYYLAIVGFVGSIAPVIENTEITYQISEFLLKSIEIFLNKENHKDSPDAISIVIESINLIFDIFGDKDFSYDYEIYVGKDYNSKLIALEPKVKDTYKKIDKHKYGDLKIRAEEAWVNLGRFIQYKLTERN